MPTTPRHTFPKAEKLKSRKQIDLVFREGKSFFAAPVKCYYRVDGLVGVKSETANVKVNTVQVNMEIELTLVNEKSENTIISDGTNTPHTLTPPAGAGGFPNLKSGFSVSKKQFKHAVDRNRVKRLLREAYRLHKLALQSKLAGKPMTLEVFFVFTDRTLPGFALVEEKMKYCLRRLGKIVEGGS